MNELTPEKARDAQLRLLIEGLVEALGKIARKNYVLKADLVAKEALTLAHKAGFGLKEKK